MKRFVVYDKTTRQVLREGQCADAAFAAQAQKETEAVIDPARCLKRTYIELLPLQETEG